MNRKGIRLFILFAVLAMTAFIGIFQIGFAGLHTQHPQVAITAKEVTKKVLKVPGICQYPSLPTGCESTAATMVLQYYGAEISAEEFAENWLARSMDFYYVNGELYGPDPHEVFVGDPFSENAYGCYATPIVEAINRNSGNFTARRITDVPLKTLCETYIDKQRPLLIWATMGMREPEEGRTWRIENGRSFTWITGEHCLVLTGYDEQFYFLNDPQTGGTVAYQKSLVEKRFVEMGMQAVYIYKRSDL